MMLKPFTLLSFLLAGFSCGAHPPLSDANSTAKETVQKCGVERIAVKTSADKDATKVNMVPVPTTVTELTSITPPTQKDLEATPDSRFPAELKTYTVQAYLVGFKLESDEDFHIVIRDLSSARAPMMIVEMPSENCVPDALKKDSAALRASWQARFGEATKRFKNVSARKTKVEITGIGFFDLKHNDLRRCLPGEKPTKKNKKGKMVCTGQDGVAKNGIELHRVLSWKELFATSQKQ